MEYIKYDNGEEEDVTIRQLMACQKLYGKHKQYNMVVQTCTVQEKTPSLSSSKKKKQQQKQKQPSPLSTTTVKNCIPTGCIEPINLEILTDMTNPELKQELRLRKETLSGNKIELQMHLTDALLKPKFTEEELLLVKVKVDNNNYPLLLLWDEDGESVTTHHNNYNPWQSYTYKVNHANGDNPVNKPFELNNVFAWAKV